MINLAKYKLDNSFEIKRHSYLPNKYIFALVDYFKNYKVHETFDFVSSMFDTSSGRKSAYIKLIKDYFITEHKKATQLKDCTYKNAKLFNPYPFSYSLENGKNLISEFLHQDDITIYPQITTYMLLHASFDDIKEFLNKRNSDINCGINQNLFDFVITRECIANQNEIKHEEIANVFFELILYVDIIESLVDNVKPENTQECVNTLNKLHLSDSDLKFHLDDLSEFKKMSIDEIYFHFGENVGMLVNVLNFYSENPRNVIQIAFKNYLSSLDPKHAEILRRRETETLEEIGQSEDRTRERIRQIEAKEIKNFNEFYFNNFSTKTKNLIFVFPEVTNVFQLNRFKNELGPLNDAFRNIFSSINYQGEAKYIKELDAVVESSNLISLFNKIVDEIFGNYFKEEDLDFKIKQFLLSLKDSGFNEENIRKYISCNYRKIDKCFVKKGFQLSKAQELDILLEKYFDNGLHYSDRKDMELLNKLSMYEFGNEIVTISNNARNDSHIIQEILRRTNARQVGRGTFIHVSKAIDIPMPLVEKMMEYLNTKGGSIAYSDLYSTFNTELLEIGITNKFELQGALSIYKDVLFISKRDYINPVFVDKTLRETMNDWILKEDGLFDYEDFTKEFKGAAKSVFISVITDCKVFAYYWGRGYINVNKLNISDEEKQGLFNAINFLINQYHNEYCSADELFGYIKLNMSEFIQRINLKYSYDLFSVVQILFSGKFKFNRPLVGSFNAIFENKYELVDSYLVSKNVAKLTKLRKFIDSKNGSIVVGYYPIYDIVVDKRNEFVAIDVDTIIRKESLNITEKEITRLDVVIDMLLDDKEELNIEEDIINKDIFAEFAGIKANKYLVFGLINTFLSEKYSLSISESTHFRGGTFYIKRLA